jgi:hypothetical protein
LSVRETEASLYACAGQLGHCFSSDQLGAFGVVMIPTMQSGNCFNGPGPKIPKLNVKSESFPWIHVKNENSKNNSPTTALHSPQARRFSRFRDGNPNHKL